jgi:hypothetical protein
MEFEKQVCSLEHSKRFKELGVKQESLWWWHRQKCVKLHQNCDCPKYHLTTKNLLFHSCFATINYDTDFSAFTCAELGKLLPRQIELTHPNDNYWKIVYREPLQIEEGKVRSNTYPVEADTEANARAKMLIYLLENKLIPFQGYTGR